MVTFTAILASNPRLNVSQNPLAVVIKFLEKAINEHGKQLRERYAFKQSESGKQWTDEQKEALKTLFAAGSKNSFDDLTKLHAAATGAITHKPLFTVISTTVNSRQTHAFSHDYSLLNSFPNNSRRCKLIKKVAMLRELLKIANGLREKVNNKQLTQEEAMSSFCDTYCAPTTEAREILGEHTSNNPLRKLNFIIQWWRNASAWKKARKQGIISEPVAKEGVHLDTSKSNTDCEMVRFILSQSPRSR